MIKLHSFVPVGQENARFENLSPTFALANVLILKLLDGSDLKQSDDGLNLSQVPDASLADRGLTHLPPVRVVHVDHLDLLFGREADVVPRLLAALVAHLLEAHVVAGAVEGAHVHLAVSC